MPKCRPLNQIFVWAQSYCGLPGTAGGHLGYLGPVTSKHRLLYPAFARERKPYPRIAVPDLPNVDFTTQLSTRSPSGSLTASASTALLCFSCRLRRNLIKSLSSCPARVQHPAFHSRLPRVVPY